MINDEARYIVTDYRTVYSLLIDLVDIGKTEKQI